MCLASCRSYTHSQCSLLLLTSTAAPPNSTNLDYRDKYRFYACMMRARFDEAKDEKDMVKATMMLKAGEEEFWSNQHPQPYLFPDSPGGTSYERYEMYKVTKLEDCPTSGCALCVTD